MKKFKFGEIVVPTIKACIRRLAWPGDRAVVLYDHGQSVRVCIEGYKLPRDYHKSFWRRPKREGEGA